MKSKTHFIKLRKLLSKPSFSAEQALKVGVSSSVLFYYVKTGLLNRISRGVYQSAQFKSPSTPWEDLITTAYTIPYGLICLISALDIYHLTEEIPRKHWIAVSNDRIAPKRPHAKIIRMRDVALGKTTIQIGNQKVFIFDKERTVVDAFRLLPIEVAIKALKKGLYEKKGKERLNIKKLRYYAKRQRVNLDPYILTITS